MKMAPDLETAVYFSTVTFSTLGYGGRQAAGKLASIRRS
jgi:hypothetical protein